MDLILTIVEIERTQQRKKQQKGDKKKERDKSNKKLLFGTNLQQIDPHSFGQDSRCNSYGAPPSAPDTPFLWPFARDEAAALGPYPDKHKNYGREREVMIR